MDAYKDAMKKKMQGFKDPKKEDEKLMDMAPPREGLLGDEKDEVAMEGDGELSPHELSVDEVSQVRELLSALADKEHPGRQGMSLGGMVADKAKQDLEKLK